MTIRLGFHGAGLITQLHTWLLSESGVDHAIVAVHDPHAVRVEAFAAAHGGAGRRRGAAPRPRTS